MRRAVSSLLALLTAIALVLAAASSWTTRTALDTRSFVAQVGPVIDQQPVRDAIASDVSAQITALLHLPTAKALIEREVRLFVGKPSFRPIWLAALASVHRQVVAAVTGPDVALQQVGGEIYLDLIDVVVQVLHDLPPVALSLVGTSGTLHVPAGATGTQTRSLVSAFLGRDLPAGFATVPLLPTKDLQVAKTAVGLIDRSVTVLLVVAAVLLAAGLAISRRRARTLAELGLWFAALTTAAYFIALGVGHAITTGLTVDTARPVAVAVVDALFNSLRSPATVLVASGIVVAVLSLLASLLVPRARGRARA